MRATSAGAGGLALLACAAMAAPWLPGDPYATDLRARLRPPSQTHLLGADALGRDLLARLVYGGRLSLAVGLASVSLSLIVGVALGAIAGLRGGWVDEAVGRLMDVFLAFPGLLLAILLAAVLGPSIPNVVLALSAFGWTSYARLTRAQVRSIRRRPFVEAAEALGVGRARLLLAHVLPPAVPALVVQATFGFAAAVTAEASLSFLGLGAPPPTPSWGAMLDEARGFLLVAPHLALVPGMALTLTILATQLLGDGLRDVLDVRDDTRDQR